MNSMPLGPVAGQIAFWIGLFICYVPARDSVDEQRIAETVKQTTGLNTIYGQVVPRKTDLVPKTYQKKSNLNSRRH